MGLRSEACAECTQNCLLMHKKDKNPSPVATSFFKVMFGDDYSKCLFLPPRIAHSLRKKVGKSTWLEDSSGEKWKVKYTNIDGSLAFEEGWNTFWLDHGLKVGDFLVFHYIMDSHFVVSMYGESGCPELRHFRFTRHHIKETRKEHKLTTVDHHVQSNANTNGHHSEVKDSDRSQQKETTIKKKTTDDIMPPNVNALDTDNHLVASSARSQPSDSDKETSQRSKPLVNTEPDKTVCETPTNVKNNNSVHVEDLEDDDLEVNNLHDVSIPEISPNKSSGTRKDDVAAAGGGDETKIKESGKVLETPPKKTTEKPKEYTNKSSIKKRLRSTMFPMSPAKRAKKESALTSQTDVSASKLCNAGSAPASPGSFLKPKVKTATPPKIIKKEPDTSGSKLDNAGLPHKPIDKPTEAPKKNLTINHDPTGVIKTSPGAKTDVHNSHKEDNLQKVKPEPVDHDEAPSGGPTNTSFSAVMSSYKYLELPKWVKLKSKVVLLRNKADLWPVLYQKKMGMQALTQSWEVYARQRGIEPGDTCDFVLESEASSCSNSTCSVFMVHVSRK